MKKDAEYFRQKFKKNVSITTFEYPSYFVGYVSHIKIETGDYTDQDYHDAPSHLTIDMEIADMIYLRDELNKAIDTASEIHKKYLDREPTIHK